MLLRNIEYSMVYDYSRREFSGACEEVGGNPSEPEDEVFVCDFGDHKLIVHSYLDPEEEGSAILDGGRRGADWRSKRADLSDDGRNFIMEDAEGNPGPQGGMPMHVDDARVEISAWGVDAERRQRL
jgi:hypothetical protein